MSRGFGDNGDGGIVLSGVLDHGDLLVVIDALSFQSTRSRFFGGGPDISDRLDAIVEKLKSVSPLPPGERTHGYEWFRACSSVKSSAFFGCYLVEERTGYDSRAYHLDVVADRSVQRVVRGGSRGEIEAALQGVSSCLRELAPLSAEPVVILAGTLELSAPVEVPGTHRETGAERREVLRPLAEAVGKALSTVTPYVHLIDATGSWGPATTVEVRVAVPASCVAAVIGLAGGMGPEESAEADVRQPASSRFP